MKRRDIRIQHLAKFTAAHERHLSKEVLRFLLKAGNAAVKACEAGNFKQAEVDAVNAIKLAKPKMQQMIATIVTEAIKFQQEEFKSCFCLETKISLTGIYRGAIALWSKVQASRMIKGISETTRKFIKGTVDKGLEKGEGNQKIANKIKKKLTGPAAARRALMISRTETHNAVQKASFETALQSGIEMEKEWGATEDQRTRPTHRRVDGTVVGIKDTFQVGASQMLYPGDPNGSAKEVINCRCVALYWPKGLRP